MISGDNPLRLIHELKGCALSIVCILSVLRRATPALELARYSGYDADTITKALRKLEDPVLFGFVLRTSQGWYLADGVAQLPLSWLVAESENFGSVSLTTTTTIEENKETQIVVVPVNPKFSDSFDLLRELGVGHSVALSLAGLEWVSPEYVQAHAAPMDLQNDMGLFITRIRDHDPAPKSAKPAAVVDQVQAFMRRRK
jgi:hypothetical protein